MRLGGTRSTVLKVHSLSWFAGFCEILATVCTFGLLFDGDGVTISFIDLELATCYLLKALFGLCLSIEARGFSRTGCSVFIFGSASVFSAETGTLPRILLCYLLAVT